MALFNCEIELNLKWARDCIILEISKTFRAVDPIANQVVHQVTSQTTSATFPINNDKLYVPVVTFSIKENIKFLENAKKDLKEQFLGTNIDLK